MEGFFFPPKQQNFPEKTEKETKFSLLGQEWKTPLNSD